MAFINEKLTEEERAEFAAKAIPNPGNPFHTLKPIYWTIDRESDVFLVWGLEEREEPHDIHFLLSWKGRPIPVKLGDRWLDGSTRFWELKKIQLTPDLIDERFAILENLNDALEVYAFNGKPDDAFNITTRVKTNILPDRGA